MSYSILVPLSDSVSSRAVVDFLCHFMVCKEETRLTLLNVFRRPSSGEQLMGHRFMEQLPGKYMAFLQSVKERMVEEGYHPEKIEIIQITEPFDTVTDGIIDYFGKSAYDMVIIGRKKMTKAEEFVSGDVSVKLLRSLDNAAVLVVKCE